MRSLLVSYLRFAGFSVAALVVASCARIAPPQGMAGPPEPRFGEAPQAELMSPRMHPVPASASSEAERIEALEAQVDALGSEIAHLRKALDVMGPLPDPDGMFIPVSMSDITGELPATDPETEAAARLARLYAPPPSLNKARSLFYEAELGSFGSRATAAAVWDRVAAGNRLAGLQPRFSTAGDQTRLTAGPLASEAAVDALCVELSALAGACRVAAPIRAY